MGVFLVEAIREVYGQMYAMALDEEGEGYVAKVDRLEYWDAEWKAGEAGSLWYGPAGERGGQAADAF